ncbi:MAG: hypothetical protein M0005_18045 [Actinomycetota bacterium]|jgi:hypothetical protein|nr:hypothetical protein [Actinomycetota bacterium]
MSQPTPMAASEAVRVLAGISVTWAAIPSRRNSFATLKALVLNGSMPNL